MTRLLILIVMLFCNSRIISQNCNCLSQFDYVITYFEANNPAYQKLKSSNTDLRIYTGKKSALRKEVIRNKDKNRCIVYLEKYVELLKDHHSNITYKLKRIPLSTPEQITEFKNSSGYQSFKKLTINIEDLQTKLQACATNDIEGIYTDGRNTTFGVIADDQNPGEYIGVVLKPNKLVDAGHVLLHLQPLGSNNYYITYNVGLFGFNFDKIYKTQTITNGNMAGLGFHKTNAIKNNESPYNFYSLNTTTNYLQLKSFESKHINRLENYYDSIIPLIKSKPNLIIDLRDNGGGSEASYYKLLPLVYTQAIKTDSVDVWVSPQNIDLYQKNKKDSLLIARMKNAKPYSFIPQSQSPNCFWKLDSATLFPKKIAVLFNNGTASAAEGFIYYLIQSKKVLTFGQNSGGYIGYGDVMEHPVPDGDYVISSTTTRYYDKSKYEFIGIEPMYLLNEDQNWIETASALLNNSL